jgi:hypothetical protein
LTETVAFGDGGGGRKGMSADVWWPVRPRNVGKGLWTTGSGIADLWMADRIEARLPKVEV